MIEIKNGCVMQWFNMHGYAVYIWSAYGIAAIVLSAHAISAKLYAKKILQLLRSLVN